MPSLPLPRFARLGLAHSLTLALVACDNPRFNGTGGGPGDGTASLGELVYRIIVGNLRQADDCSPELVDAMVGNHERFVTTFDHTIERELVDSVPELLGGTIKPLVDSGDMPALVDALAEALALLISDEFDADRETLAALASAGDARSVLEGSEVMKLALRVLRDDDLPARIHDLANLAQAHDGVDYVLDGILDVVARQLTSESFLDECSGLEVPDLEETLLSTDDFVDTRDLGAPAWTARADANGNPRVLNDPSRGTIAAPFLDADRDGNVDTDDRGRPIDADGAVIDIPTRGTGEGYDDQGRALNENGTLLYDYYDAKRTALSWALQLGRDAVDDDIHHLIVPIADAVLGDAVECDDGTETCRHYPGSDHPLADMVWILIEIGEYERALAFLDTLAVIIDSDPARADALLLQIGYAIEAMQRTDLELLDPTLIDLAIELGPLLEDIFEVNNTSGQSTPRLLLDLLHELDEETDALPTQLGYIIDHRQLVKSNTCSSGPPNLSASTPVDYSRPRFYGSTDNRSSLEQVIHLLDVAECGNLFGETVAYQFLDILADQSPDTVCSIIDLLLGVIGTIDYLERIPFIGDIVALILDVGINFVMETLIGCPDGQAVWNALTSLEGLAASGALDVLIPLARVFKDQGQLDTMIDLLQFVERDLVQDEDGNPNTESVVRRALPAISDMIDSGAVAELLDLVDVLVTVPASDGDGTLADVVIDSIERVTETRSVRTRTGSRSNTTLLRELLLPAREMAVRLNSAGADDEFSDLLGFLTRQLTRRTSVAGQPTLANRNLRPLLGVALRLVREIADLPSGQLSCYMNALQDASAEGLTGRDFAFLVRLVETFSTSEFGPPLEDYALTFLSANAEDDEADLYGPLMHILSSAATSQTTDTDLSVITRYIAAVAGQRRDDARELIAIVDRMLAADEDGVVLQIVRNLLEPGPLESGEAPLCTMGDVASDVAAIRPAYQCEPAPEIAFDTADLEETITGVTGFLEDDDNGIGAVWRLVGRLRTEGAAEVPEVP